VLRKVAWLRLEVSEPGLLFADDFNGAGGNRSDAGQEAFLGNGFVAHCVFAGDEADSLLAQAFDLGGVPALVLDEQTDSPAVADHLNVESRPGFFEHIGDVFQAVLLDTAPARGRPLSVKATSTRSQASSG